MPECKIKFWLFPTPLVVIRKEEYLERFQAICVLIPTAHEGAWCGAHPTSKDPDMSPGAGEYHGPAVLGVNVSTVGSLHTVPRWPS